MSADKENAYFASGIKDEILTKLAAIDDLKVISRASTEKYRSHPEDVRKVASELGVATILEGSVHKAGDSAHINVQLIDARIDSHLWAQVYDRDLKNVFAVEGEVAEEVAAALKLKLLPSAAAELASPPTKDPKAYDLYFVPATRTRNGFGYRRSQGSIRVSCGRRSRAIRILRRPTRRLQFTKHNRQTHRKVWIRRSKTMRGRTPKRHSHYSPTCRWQAPRWGSSTCISIVTIRRLFVLLKRKTCGFSIATAVAQGRIGYWSDAVQTMRRVVELNPRDAHSFQALAFYYGVTRHYEEAISAADQTIALDPNNWVCAARKANLLLARGQVDAAREILERVRSR